MWFDTETGGTIAKVHSLLTAYFAICDKNLNVIDELYLQLKPEDVTKLNLSPEAMAVNKIDINEHLKDPNTVTYQEGRVKLKNFLLKNKIKGKRKSFMPCGHNVSFDKEFIWEQLMPQDEFEEEVHYRTIDTSSICTFLKDVEILPVDVGSLGSLVEHFGIPPREAHTAKGDVLMNIEVYKAMKNMMKTRKKDTIGGTDSLLKILEG
jgi:oligoribonuclease (3'-5' exoribonuclease)